jgi:signal transduction histidine kinase
MSLETGLQCATWHDIERKSSKGPTDGRLGEKRLWEMVALGCSLPEILNAICRFVEDQYSESRCSIYLVDANGAQLRNAAAPNLPQVLNDEICHMPVRSEIAPCARAVCLKKQVIVGDLVSDRLWRTSQFAYTALNYGLRSCWSTPIFSAAQHVLGTLAIFHCSPALPTARQKDLISRTSHICSIAIQRAQREAALERSETFLAEAERLSSTGSFSWRVATDEITWSEQMYRIFQFEKGVPLTLELIASRVHPEDLDLLSEMVCRARRCSGEIECEHRLLMPDYSVKYLHMVAQGSRDHKGQLQYIGAVQDVTQRRLSEEALAKARTELVHAARLMNLGALSASIAHEVSQPLSGMMTNASTCLRMLTGDSLDVEGARETVRRVIRDGSRASDVITRLRALFGRKETRSELVDLNQAAQQVVALTLSELKRNRITLQLELDHKLPPIMGDCVQLQQVMLNFIRNALDAMSCINDRPRQLVIRTQRDGDNCVRLSVKDTGVGFELQSVGSLFEPFYTTRSDGMGIGLSISRLIIERHHGRVWATLNDGPGATFAFSIPQEALSETTTYHPAQDAAARIDRRRELPLSPQSTAMPASLRSISATARPLGYTPEFS